MKPGRHAGSGRARAHALAKRLPARFGGSANYARLIEQHRAVVRPLDEQMLGPRRAAAVGAAGRRRHRAADRLRQRRQPVHGARGRTASRPRGARARSARRAASSFGCRCRKRSSSRRSRLPRARRSRGSACRSSSAPRPPGVPRLRDVGMTPRRVLFTLGAACCRALACGLVPAIRASSPDLTRLREGGRGATRGRHWGRNGLVVGQTAFALVLLIGSGLLRAQLLRRCATSIPATTRRTSSPSRSRRKAPHLPDGPAYRALRVSEFMDRLRALPGVRVGRARRERPAERRHRQRAVPHRGHCSEPDAGTRLGYTFAAGDYFKAMGIDVAARAAVRHATITLSTLRQRRHQPVGGERCCGRDRIAHRQAVCTGTG